jgi:hypothetical protein
MSRLPMTMCFFAACLSINCFAGTLQSAIHVGSTIAISADNPAVPLAETWLDANPRDPKNMIAVSMAFPKEGAWASVMYFTLDGGKSWQRATHGPGREAYFWGADPVVAFGSNGVAYYSDLEWAAVGTAPFDDHPRSRGKSSNVYMYRSADGGRTWSDPIALYGNDHSAIAIDESQGKYRGRVYVVYTGALHNAQGKGTNTLGFAYSDDDGRSYNQRIFLPPTVGFADRVQEGPSALDLVVAPNGTVVVAYGYLLKPEAPTERALIYQMWSMASVDGGRTFSEGHLVRSISFPVRNDGSFDLWEKVQYWPRMAVDSSQGSNRGRLYFAYEDFSSGRVSIAVISSNDLGQTWGEPVQVNDDRTNANQTTPQMAVGGNGVVGVSWYDHRNDPKDRCYQAYFSASLDAGVTFLPNVVVREPATCTMGAGNWQPNVTQELDASRGTYGAIFSSPRWRFQNGGETQGLVSLGGGDFQLVWADAEGGNMQLSTTSVGVPGTPLGQDVGDLLQVDLGFPELDIGAHAMSLQVTVTNRSHRAIAAPVTLVLSRMETPFTGLQAVNAENGLTGVGASWIARQANANRILQPGETAAPIALKFKFEKAPGTIPTAPALWADFHIFERSP